MRALPAGTAVRRGVAIPAAAALLAASLVGSVRVEPATAHCPGTAIPNNGRDYSAGTRSIAGVATAKGIHAKIDWSNPNICTTPAGNAFSLQVVNICNTSSCGGWVQVGYRKDQGQAAPRFYCEYHNTNGTKTILYAPLVQGNWDYRATYDSFDGVWDCILEGSGKFARGGLGFVSGTWLVAQGEVNATHGQIGLMAPGKTWYQGMQYLNAANAWKVFDVNGLVVEVPYGGDEPNLGLFRNWTNAH